MKPQVQTDIEARVQDTGDALTGTLTWPGNIVALNFRTGGYGSYDGTVTYQTAGNEALVFGTRNLATSFIFINGEDTITNNAADRWCSLTPGLQIKNNCVSIGQLWGDSINPNYKFRVTGTSYLNGPVTIEGTLTANDTITAPAFIGALQGEATSASSLKSSSHLTTVDAMNNFVYANEVKFATFKLDEDSNGLGFQNNDGMLLSIPWASTTYAVQLAVDDAGRKMSIRSKTTTWSDWTRVLTSDNYTDYTVTKTGTGASGTWGISIGGNADTATAITYPPQLTSDNAIDNFNAVNKFQVGTWNSTSSPGVNNGIIVNFGWTSSTYGAQIAIDDDPTYYLSLRQKNGNGWSAWKRIPMGDGTGASGTWSISINGTATKAVQDGNGSVISSTYLKLSGGTMTGKLQVNAPIFGYNYTNGRDKAAFIWDKPGSNYTGIGDCGEADTIFFSASDIDGIWIKSYKQKWKFNGNIIADNITATAVYGAVWNDYAEYRSQETTIQPGYCVRSQRNGKLLLTAERLSPCEGVVSDTFGFAIGETEESQTPIAVSGRVLVYVSGNRDDYEIGDCLCAGPGGLAYKMTREEIKEYPDRIIGTVSEIPEYEIWGTGEISVNKRIWINVK